MKLQPLQFERNKAGQTTTYREEGDNSTGKMLGLSSSSSAISSLTSLLLVISWIAGSEGLSGFLFEDNKSDKRYVPENGEINYKIPTYPNQIRCRLQTEIIFLGISINIFQFLLCTVCKLQQIFQHCPHMGFQVCKLNRIISGVRKFRF